ncbi:MAG: gliding motility-associated protein GldE [Bacteroidales bacterium]|nr:gliding motility-associated protein GldE [Bacteroidales bacterium]
MDTVPLSPLLSILCDTTTAAQPAITFQAPTFGVVIALIVAGLALLFSAFNSGSEIAFFSITKDEINEIRSRSNRRRIKMLLAKPEKLLATILIGNNIVNVLIVIVLNYAMTRMMQFNSAIANFLVQTVILTFLILLFGEVIPKLYASNNNVKFAIRASGTIGLMMKLFSPISKLMVKSTFIVRKAVPAHVDEISVEDLSRALEASDVKSSDEKEMLKGILAFGNKTVGEIMRPRIDIVDIDIESKFSEVVKTVVENGYSRMPVYQDNPDNVKGMLYAKDLLPYIGKRDDSFKWQALMRPVYFVPETRMIDDLLEDFRKKKVHMAIVVDEFGCVQGIATMEDLLEEIVGDIDDEYDTEEKYFTKESENTFIFDAKTPLDEFYDATDTDAVEFGDYAEEVESLAGLLLNIKGDFLQEKEEITCNRCKFTVLKVKKYRIAKVRVVITESKPEEE